jgi:hypothetical protein
MHRLRYILVPWTVILVYSLFSAFLGQSGVYARRHLEAERLQLLENHRELERIYQNSLRTKDSLMNDPDALSVYARQLGYGRESEEFIRIMGLSVAVNADMPIGQVLYATTPLFVPDKHIKIIAAFVGLAVLLYFLVVDFFLHKGIGRE